MTHAELIATRRRAPHLEPSACPGALNAVGRYPDRVLGPAGSGLVRDREVTVWLCDACGARIPEGEGEVINVWWDGVIPPDAVLGLAAERVPVPPLNARPV